MMRNLLRIIILIILFLASSLFENVYAQSSYTVSGITTPVAANGVYVYDGIKYGYNSWVHTSGNYYIYKDEYAGEYYWNIDDNTDDNDAGGVLFAKADNTHIYTYPPPNTYLSNDPGAAIYGIGAPVISVFNPSITFTNGSAYSLGNALANTNNNILGRFSLQADVSGVNMTALVISIAGVRTGISNIKLWSSTDQAFNSGSDVQLNTQADAATVTFNTFTSAVTTSAKYYFITADLAINASGSLTVTIGSQANITISSGSWASNFTNAALTSGAVTIDAVKEINIKGNANSITNGDGTPSLTDHTAFGSANTSGSTIIRTFTIENLGAATLSLSGASLFIAISGANAGDFSVSAIPSSTISGNSSTTFQITFNPSVAGLRSAVLSIANDDADENPYTFNIEGTGVSYPEIAIYGNSTLIADGDVTPTTADDTDFGNVDINAGTQTKTYTIQNTGDGILTLTDASPYVTISGANVGDFSVSAIPSSTINSNASTTFQITFNPSAVGTRSATLSIANDDADENPYNFSIQGSGIDAPTVQSHSIAASAQTSSSMTLSWTRGNGSSCAAFMKAAVNTGSQAPVNSVTYSASTDWNAKGTELGTGWYCIYNGSSAIPSINITNLAEGEYYRIEVFEYSGAPGSENFLVDAAVNNPANSNTLASNTFVSAGYSSGNGNNPDNNYWNIRYFGSISAASAGSASGSSITIKAFGGNSNLTEANINADNNTIVIDDADLTITGAITAAVNQIRAISTGYLILSPTQNVPKTYPLTDGTYNYTFTINCANAPAQPIKIKINADKVVSGASSTDFWDISGESGLNATMTFRLPKAALSGDLTNSFRYFDGSRYVPVSQDKISMTDNGTYYNVIITGINSF